MLITIKGIKDEDFVNYKKCSLFISWPTCTFKCDRENGCQYCQNMPLTYAPNIQIDSLALVRRYISNPITSAVVMGGLEPFDSFEELWTLVSQLRQFTDDDIVVYTGYEPDEVLEQTNALRAFKNIIIKWGRFRPNQRPHLDEVLGIKLASDNQHAEKIS